MFKKILNFLKEWWDALLYMLSVFLIIWGISAWMTANLEKASEHTKWQQLKTIASAYQASEKNCGNGQISLERSNNKEFLKLTHVDLVKGPVYIQCLDAWNCISYQVMNTTGYQEVRLYIP